jgi:hypothetical protein
MVHLFYGCISVAVRTPVYCIRHIFGVEVTWKIHVIQNQKREICLFYNYDFR